MIIMSSKHKSKIGSVREWGQEEEIEMTPRKLIVNRLNMIRSYYTLLLQSQAASVTYSSYSLRQVKVILHSAWTVLQFFTVLHT